jgi:predicted MPP superfamily phosphohydrolase
MNKISEKKVKELINELKSLSTLKDSKRKINYWYSQKQNVVNADNLSTDLIKEFLDEYNRVKKNVSKVESVDTDDRAITNIERDEEGLIQYYTFEIFRRDAPTLVGKLDRKEMETIYRLYSIYGANLTQKIVSREFPQYTFVEFKRILRAFNIYKANSEFAPHIIEEKTEEELINLHNQNKENNILRRIEKDQLAEANKLINKLASELNSLKYAKDFHFTIDNNYEPKSHVAIPKIPNTDNKSIILHISDTHVGAALSSTSLFDNEWNEGEFARRLDEIVYRINLLGPFDKIIINLLGDYLDGMDSMTARRDHVMPQNMDNKKQFNVFIRNMMHFIEDLCQLTNNLEIYAVPEGNHGGYADYFAIKALEYATKSYLPDIKFTVWDKYFGMFKHKEHTYLSMHGKDGQFMKKPMPLNLNDATSTLLRDWMDREKITGENIHVIKGDLHSDNFNSCRKFDYRNVLSLFGDSDYSQMNYVSNKSGCSYDLFIGDFRTIGTFENL